MQSDRAVRANQNLSLDSHHSRRPETRGPNIPSPELPGLIGLTSLALETEPAPKPKRSNGAFMKKKEMKKQASFAAGSLPAGGCMCGCVSPVWIV